MLYKFLKILTHTFLSFFFHLHFTHLSAYRLVIVLLISKTSLFQRGEVNKKKKKRKKKCKRGRGGGRGGGGVGGKGLRVEREGKIP